MSRIETLAREALIAGETVSLATLGGENAVYSDSDWPRSRVFGDVTEVLLGAWSALHLPSAARDAIVAGLRENEDRDALGQALDAIAAAPPPDLGPFVLALDKRVRDDATQEILRADAASAILRFSIADSRWKALAQAALHAMEEFHDEYALSMASRLAAVAWEHFRDDALVGLLERHSDIAQAAYERGVIGVAKALENDDLTQITRSLRGAEQWLQRAVDTDEDRRDAHVYLLLTKALTSIVANEPAPKHVAVELRREAVVRHHWDEPAPGREWLLPPHEAELQWIPLVDRLVFISGQLTKPSWLDVATVLSDVVKLYVAVRSVRPGMPGIERVVKPAIEAAFVRERGLLAHLTEWLDETTSDSINRDDAAMLRTNIEARLKHREGKSGGDESARPAVAPRTIGRTDSRRGRSPAIVHEA